MRQVFVDVSTEHRDKDGKWTTGGDSAESVTRKLTPAEAKQFGQLVSTGATGRGDGNAEMREAAAAAGYPTHIAEHAAIMATAWNHGEHMLPVLMGAARVFPATAQAHSRIEAGRAQSEERAKTLGIRITRDWNAEADAGEAAVRSSMAALRAKLGNDVVDHAHVTVYRGLYGTTATAPGEEHDITSNAASSWSTSLAEARKFSKAKTVYDPNTGKASQAAGIVLRMDVPLKHVLGVASTGLGNAVHKEVVVAGVPGLKAVVV